MLKPEHKKWVRCIDALLTLLTATGIGIVYFVLPLKIEIPLLKTGFYIAMITLPIVAWMLYRPSDISRLERIAIVLLVLCALLTLMIAAIETSNVI